MSMQLITVAEEQINYVKTNHLVQTKNMMNEYNGDRRKFRIDNLL